MGPLKPEPEPLEKKITGAGAGAGARAAWEKNQEPEPLEKKSGAGAGASKKFAGSPALSCMNIGSPCCASLVPDPSHTFDHKKKGADSHTHTMHFLAFYYIRCILPFK